MVNHEVPQHLLDDIVAGKPDALTIETPLKWFDEYLKQGYYPFAKEEGFDEKLRQIINLTLESDIPVFAEMSAAMVVRTQLLTTKKAKIIAPTENYL